MREQEVQRWRVLAIHHGERTDLRHTRSIPGRDCRAADEIDERALFGARQQMNSPQLEVLPRRGLTGCLETGERRNRCDSGGRQKFTSVHEYLAAGCLHVR
jgi:hypothetical protein